MELERPSAIENLIMLLTKYFIDINQIFIFMIHKITFFYNLSELDGIFVKSVPYY